MNYKNLPPANKLLYHHLAAIRERLALEQRLPKYMICNNEVLGNLALFLPESKEELLSLKGVGDRFVRKYGKEYLKAIKNFTTSHPEVENTQAQLFRQVNSLINKWKISLAEAGIHELPIKIK